MSEVRFARSGDVDIAYRVVGDGPVDLVYVQGTLTHIETNWELPQYGSGLEFEDRGAGAQGHPRRVAALAVTS